MKTDHSNLLGMQAKNSVDVFLIIMVFKGMLNNKYVKS